MGPRLHPCNIGSNQNPAPPLEKEIDMNLIIMMLWCIIGHISLYPLMRAYKDERGQNDWTTLDAVVNLMGSVLGPVVIIVWWLSDVLMFNPRKR